MESESKRNVNYLEKPDLTEALDNKPIDMVLNKAHRIISQLEHFESEFNDISDRLIGKEPIKQENESSGPRSLNGIYEGSYLANIDMALNRISDITGSLGNTVSRLNHVL